MNQYFIFYLIFSSQNMVKYDSMQVKVSSKNLPHYLYNNNEFIRPINAEFSKNNFKMDFY